NALVMPKIDVREGRGEEPHHGRLQRSGIADERVHGAIIGRIRRLIEKMHASSGDCIRQRRDHVRSTAFAHVRHAFDERHGLLYHRSSCRIMPPYFVPDPLRADSIDTSEHQDDSDRDAKIESLLLVGLDHYFSSNYTQAIDVWTRALFLDRGHARARAYIERARSALAEQQRESEELLHSGVAAFERGEMDAARHLLNAAVQRGGAHEVALAFLTRIDRISAATPLAPGAAPAWVRSPDTVTIRARELALGVRLV